jgi:iron-sulfur cluster repair protein YtfE (RIC family)
MALKQETTQETIVEQIRKDHRTTDREIAELEMRVRGRGDDDLGPVFAPMRRELLGHMAAEEKLLYPALEKEMREQIADARKEHERIRGHLEALAAGGGMEEPEWRRRLEMLKQEIQHHVTDEESEILPATSRHFDEQQLRELGSRFERMEKGGK